MICIFLFVGYSLLFNSLPPSSCQIQLWHSNSVTLPRILKASGNIFNKSKGSNQINEWFGWQRAEKFQMKLRQSLSMSDRKLYNQQISGAFWVRRQSFFHTALIMAGVRETWNRIKKKAEKVIGKLAAATSLKALFLKTKCQTKCTSWWVYIRLVNLGRTFFFFTIVIPSASGRKSGFFSLEQR